MTLVMIDADIGIPFGVAPFEAFEQTIMEVHLAVFALGKLSLNCFCDGIEHIIRHLSFDYFDLDAVYRDSYNVSIVLLILFTKIYPTPRFLVKTSIELQIVIFECILQLICLLFVYRFGSPEVSIEIVFGDRLVLEIVLWFWFVWILIAFFLY